MNCFLGTSVSMCVYSSWMTRTLSLSLTSFAQNLMCLHNYDNIQGWNSHHTDRQTDRQTHQPPHVSEFLIISNLRFS